METKNKILLDKHLILSNDYQINEDKKQNAYYNAFLLINFGIEILNPEYVDEQVMVLIDELFHLNVPAPFYKSPQDTQYYDSDELLIEQVVSYICGYGTSLKRVELFKEAVPERYVVGDELKLRQYRIINQKEADEVLKQEAIHLALYKRPFSIEEEEMFLYLFDNGYLDDKQEICCRDNIFPLLSRDIEFARRLDKKDLVKYSRDLLGDVSTDLEGRYQKYKESEKGIAELEAAIDYVRDCPLSKKQAKFYNKIVKLAKGKKGKEDNSDSPYVVFNKLMKNGEVVEAAKYLASLSGSLLERNIKYIISRCEYDSEVREVTDLLDNDNPVLLFQIFSTLMDDVKGAPRTFRFVKSRVMTTHIENAVETKLRRSTLTDSQKKTFKHAVLAKLFSHYKSLASIGKVYISEEFRNIALPVNTSTSGRGLDVLPQGSRIKFQGDYLRIFCHWDGVRDIDASLVFLKEGQLKNAVTTLHKQTLNWRTYYSHPFQGDALCSGDDTSTCGSEFQDINIKGILKMKYRYAFACINGYGALFNQGSIIQGLQVKDRIDTEPWDPKNIEFQMNIVGDCRSFTGFAVDLAKKEIIIVNALSDCGPIVAPEQINIARRYVLPYYLDFNMFDVLTILGDRVEDPKEADIVFDRDYQPLENQKVVRPYDVAALASYVNYKK